MTYTLAIVDEGLPILPRLKHNAWNEFYAREALGVRTRICLIVYWVQIQE